MKTLQPPKLKIDQILYKDRNGRPHPNGVLERRIVWNLLSCIETAGFEICSCFNGDEDEAVKSRKAAMELIFNLDETYVYFSKAGKIHWIYLVLGNGIDVLSDWGIPDSPDGFDEAIKAFDSEDYA